MAAERSDAALLLRCIPYRETSLICHVLTLQDGRMSLLAKGVRRRRRGNTQAELSSMHELRIRWREPRQAAGLGLLLDVSRLRPMLAESRWLAGQRVLALAEKLFRREGQSGYEALRQAFRCLDEHADEDAGLLRAQWHLLMRAGWAGEPHLCWPCGSAFTSESAAPLWFQGRLLCARCITGMDESVSSAGKTRSRPAVFPVERELLHSIAAAWYDASIPLSPKAERLWQRMCDSVLYHAYDA